MKKIYPFIALAIAGCAYPHYYRPIETTTPENNTGYKVSYLFEYGGCKVYRFYDLGNTVYYTNCGGDTVAFADSTQVKSSGPLRNKFMDVSRYLNEQPEKSYKYNPNNSSSYIIKKDTGYYKDAYKAPEISSSKENR